MSQTDGVQDEQHAERDEHRLKRADKLQGC